MKISISLFKDIILICLYLLIINFIFITLIWWINDTNIVFFEPLNLIKKQVFRYFTIETMILSFIPITLYIIYLDSIAIEEYSTGQLWILLQDKDMNLIENTRFLNNLSVIIAVGLGGIFIMSFLSGQQEWEIVLHRIILQVLPVTIATMFAFLLQIPISFGVISVGDFIVKRVFKKFR